jgi:signal transduction histidine kinase
MARELKVRLEEIDQQRRETEEVLNTIREPLFVIDTETRVRRLNAAASRFIGVAPDEAMGRLFTELFRNSAVADFLRRLQDDRFVQEEVVEGVGPGEQYLAVWGVRLSSRGSLLRDMSLLVLRDVTAQYRLDRTRRDFVSNVSHELRTPLTMIQGAAENPGRDSPSDEESRRTFEGMILAHAGRMGRIVEDLLSLGPSRAGEQDRAAAPGRRRLDRAGVCGRRRRNPRPGRRHLRAGRACLARRPGGSSPSHSPISWTTRCDTPTVTGR